MTRRLFTLLLASAVGLSSTLCAQNVKPTQVRLRLLAFQNSEKVKEIYIHDPAAPADTPPATGEIKRYLNDQAVTLDCYSPKLFITRDKGKDSVTSQESLIAEVNLPKNTSSVLLLFLPGKAGDVASSQVLVVDDSMNAFPAGSYLVTNISQTPTRIHLEKKVFNFNPGARSLIINPPVQANNHSGMHAFARTNNEWRPIASGIWPHPGRARSLLVLYPNPTTGTVNLRAFGDVPPRAPAEIPTSAAL